jgi:glucosyl-3-phosphoglycerate synthase
LWAVTELLARPVLSALRPSHGLDGLDGLAQVNLGVRKHRNGSLLQLGAWPVRFWAPHWAGAGSIPAIRLS